MTFVLFLKENARWLAGGFLLTLFSSFGQTFFISLSAGNIRGEFDLSHGEFGILYMIATLASALTLPRVGHIVDQLRVSTTVLFTAPMLALAAASMALSSHILVLVVAIYLLRLFGQGMMTHIAMTAMGRWFFSQRGRAVSVATIGHQAGEAMFPILFVGIALAIGWRGAWLAAAGAVLLLALPAVWMLMQKERSSGTTDAWDCGRVARQWTRRDVLRDRLFYLLLLGVLAPPFIGTTIFFHQVYLVELRGWSLEAFALSFAVMSATTIVCTLLAGSLIDRFSAVAMLPGFLIPLGFACITLSLLEQQWSAFAFMALLGVSYGFSSTMFGALWPEIYGSRHLGAIRSIIVSAMVFATALGPGVTGYFIDHGVNLPLQIGFMGVYCLAVSILMLRVARRIAARRTSPGQPIRA